MSATFLRSHFEGIIALSFPACLIVYFTAIDSLHEFHGLYAILSVKKFVGEKNSCLEQPNRNIFWFQLHGALCDTASLALCTQWVINGSKMWITNGGVANW